jgi:hypothetical protein
MKKFPFLLFTSVALLSTGCSRSLNGLVYDRGSTKAEFNYPHVQYGHVEAITPIDESGTTIGTETIDEKKVVSPSVDAPLSSSSLARSRITIAPAEKPSDLSSKAREVARIDQLKQKATQPTHANSVSADQKKVIEITSKIKELGIYDPKCTDEKRCPLPPAIQAAAEKPLPQKIRIKVRLDSGVDYFFNQPITPTWNPKPADRVKVFFDSDADTTTTLRALRVEQAVTIEQPAPSIPVESTPAEKAPATQ